MSTKEEIIELLQNILEFEKDTLSLYEAYINRLSDIGVIGTFKQLRDEEVQHVKLIEDLLKRLNVNFR
jgi:rubrerythrin